MNEFKSSESNVPVEHLLRNMMIRDKNRAAKTIEATTQLGKYMVRIPMQRHIKSRYPQLNVACLMEKYATDTWFSRESAIDGKNVLRRVREKCV